MAVIRGLTLTQPWATLVALRAKQIETRSWRTNYRGWLAIHAGKGLGPVGGMDGLLYTIRGDHFFQALVGNSVDNKLMDSRIAGLSLPRGAIIAVARLTDCKPTGGTGPKYADFVHDLSPQERAFGDYTPGRFAWLLSDIRPLAEPLICKGAQGLWAVPPALQAQIEAQTGVRL